MRQFLPQFPPPFRTASACEPLKGPMTKHSEFIHGTCQQLLFSPKGGVEGALVKVRGSVVQVSVCYGPR